MSRSIVSRSIIYESAIFGHIRVQSIASTDWSVMNIPIAIIVGSVLIAASLLFVGRWEISTPLSGPVLLDRWTGKVLTCATANAASQRRLEGQSYDWDCGTK